MANNAVIARRLASQLWGKPDTQYKLADGIWWFDTPSHGGIVIDVDVRPEPIQFHRFSDVVYINARSNRYRISEQHFCSFEEDCDAQIIIWLYADECVTPKLQRHYVDKDKPFEEWRANYLALLRKSLESWHPEVLEKYPEPGHRKF